MAVTLHTVTPDPQRPLLTTQAASDYLRTAWGIPRSVRTLQELRRRGTGPRYRRSGNTIVYAPEAIDSWVRARFGIEVSSTSEESATRQLAETEG
jgi:hypothetical protein